MNSIDKNDYYELAYEAFCRVQRVPDEFVRERKYLYNLLADDKWWMGFSRGNHIYIAKTLKEYKKEIENKYRENEGEIRYHYFVDNHIVFEPTDKGELIYHYTSIDALLNILKEKKIRLMNSDYTNDSKEISYLADIVFADACKQMDDPTIIQLFEEYYRSSYSSPVYFTSFSELEDDAAQWERYADNGLGVRVAFSKKRLLDIFGKWVQIKKVYYPPQSGNTTRITKKVVDYCVSKRGKADLIYYELFRQSIWYKHQTFKAEKEVRMVACETEWKKAKLKPQYSLVKDNRELREFLELSLMTKKNVMDVIDNIKLGPKSTCSEKLLLNKLKSFGYNIMISKSDAPLR